MQNRRQFLAAILPACSFACFGLGNLSLTSFGASKDLAAIEKHKFQLDWTHTYEEAFRWRYEYYINLMKKFGDYMGRDKLISMIKKATDEYIMADTRNDEDFNFTRWLEGGNVYINMMSREIVELTDRTYEMKVTECLWSKIFIEYDAADIGYATVCYSDFASASVTHPKLRLERTKTIMEGHGYCDHRWVLDI
jgi:hypothetical protein